MSWPSLFRCWRAAALTVSTLPCKSSTNNAIDDWSKEERYVSVQEMADDLRHPEKVDLKWIDEPDPPMMAILPTKRTNWIVIAGSVLLAILLALVLILLRKH
jgi:hypothetical protein